MTISLIVCNNNITINLWFLVKIIKTLAIRILVLSFHTHIYLSTICKCKLRPLKAFRTISKKNANSIQISASWEYVWTRNVQVQLVLCVSNVLSIKVLILLTLKASLLYRSYTQTGNAVGTGRKVKKEKIPKHSSKALSASNQLKTSITNSMHSSLDSQLKSTLLEAKWNNSSKINMR